MALLRRLDAGVRPAVVIVRAPRAVALEPLDLPAPVGLVRAAGAPAHHEVDVLAAAGVGEIAVGGVADDDVLRLALAAEVLFVELAEVHVGLLPSAGEVRLARAAHRISPRPASPVGA